MQCKICGEIYGKEFDEDFKGEICLPCQVYIWWEKEETKEKRQMNEYNEIHKTNYKSYEDFYYACLDNKNKKEDLKKFKKLLEIHKHVEYHIAEYKYNHVPEKTLFDGLYEEKNIPF